MDIRNPQPFYSSGKAPPGVNEMADRLLPALNWQGQFHYFPEVGNLPREEQQKKDYRKASLYTMDMFLKSY